MIYLTSIAYWYNLSSTFPQLFILIRLVLLCIKLRRTQNYAGQINPGLHLRCIKKDVSHETSFFLIFSAVRRKD